MENKKLGQAPAFPNNSHDLAVKGITKRYYTACKILPVLIAECHSNVSMRNAVVKSGGGFDFIPKTLVKMAYEYADELLSQENE